MAHVVVPKVFHLAQTEMDWWGLESYLNHVGAADWTSDTPDSAAYLAEVAGRSCYRSFGVGLNKNVTRVREGNENYIGNSILGQKHGSVLEHASSTFALCDVSRILTHEIVRHRQGTAFSQESGRYIRIDEMSYYMPEAFRDEAFLESVYEDLVAAGHTSLPFASWRSGIIAEYHSVMTRASTAALDFEQMMGLDHVKDFGKKKKIQSSLRRCVPNGSTNNIIVTANHRAWRYIVSARTSSAAEEEIRLVQYKVFEILRNMHPSIYQDAVLESDPDSLPSDVPVVVFKNEKV